MKLLVSVAMAAFVLGSAAIAADAPKTAPEVQPPIRGEEVSPAAFITKAVRSDMFEIRSGQLAQQRATSVELRSFAEEMVQAHNQSLQKLSDVAHAAGLMPREGIRLDVYQLEQMKELQAAAPGKFDTVYLQSQVAAHEDALDLFKKYGAQGQNPTLKDLAREITPVIQDHMNALTKLAARRR